MSYLERIRSDPGCNQTRTVGMPLKKSDFDDNEKENPFTKMASNPAKTEKQARFMRACAHGAGYASCPSEGVARKFMSTKHHTS